MLNINFNDNKLLISAYRCRNDTAVLKKFDANRLSKKNPFTDTVFNFNISLQKTTQVYAKKISDVANLR